jgi:alkylation response protein AidB-like acyl-CoA dehydrogenase
VDLSLTDEQEAMQEAARQFVDKAVVPYVRDWDRQESVDRHIVKKLGELGFLGATIPAEYGGTPCDHVAYCLLLEELGRGDSSVRGIVSVSLGLVTKTLLASASEETRQNWIPRLCSGADLACFGLTEPDTGSDAGNLATRAEPDGDSWILNGSKIFITNGTWASLALIFVRTSGPGPRGITAFAVPTSSAGFAATEIHGKLGLRGQATAELTLDGVRVPDSARVGELGQGFKIAMAALAKGRMSVAAGCVGLARACLESAVSYSTRRHQFGKSIAHYQLVQELLADMAVEVDAARLLTWRVADLIDRHQSFEMAAAKAKYYASEVAVRAANAALQVHGGYGYIDEYPVGKFLRDARVMTLYEGTSQIQKLIIGRALTGVNAF